MLLFKITKSSTGAEKLSGIKKSRENIQLAVDLTNTVEWESKDRMKQTKPLAA